jgi:putative flippase GtrA
MLMARLIALAQTNRKEFKRFTKFLAVGITGFIVDFGVFNFLLRVFQFPPVLAQGISFTMAAINNFMWNRFWTYPDSRSKPILRQFGQFFILSLIGLLIRTPIFALLSSPAQAVVGSIQFGAFAGLLNFAVNTLHLTLDQIANNAALAGAVIVVLFWNFFANRLITYGDVKLGH